MLATLFVLCFAAATFLPVSSEASLAVALAAGCAAPVSLVVATVGNTLGGFFMFWLGRSGRRLVESRRSPAEGESPEPRPPGLLEKHAGKLEKGSAWIDRGGDLAIFFCWLPVLGDAIPIAAGVLGYPPLKFLVLSGLGRLLRFWLLVLGFSAI